MEPETEPVKVYSSYTEAQKRATKKYREQNKEKVNAQRKKYYDDRKAKDPNFLSYKREKAKEYYIKKKGCEEVKEETKEEEIQPVLVEDTTTEETITPPVEKVEKVKTPRAPRKPKLKKEEPIRENIKPEDLEEIKAEFLKSLEPIIDESLVIIHNEPIEIREDTIEEHFENKSKAKEPETPKNRKKSKRT
jgi:hypothetical protein